MSSKLLGQLFCISMLLGASDGRTVTDSTGAKIQVNSPHQRIVALAPHIVENIYTAGAGDKLVGVVDYSNYPVAALDIEKVGSSFLLNLEKIIQLQPDLIIAWGTGSSTQTITRLKDLGFKVYIDEPKELSDIAQSILDIGVLAGTQEIAQHASEEYLSTLASLQQRYANSAPITVFYQVWNKPLQTINDQHIINSVIELCGGKNIYADLAMIAPVINIESLLVKNPQAIIASGTNAIKPPWLDDWTKWPNLTAVHNNYLFFVPPDHLQRHTARILLGSQSICEQLEIVRNHSIKPQ